MAAKDPPPAAMGGLQGLQQPGSVHDILRQIYLLFIVLFARQPRGGVEHRFAPAVEFVRVFAHVNQHLDVDVADVFKEPLAVPAPVTQLGKHRLEHFNELGVALGVERIRAERTRVAVAEHHTLGPRKAFAGDIAVLVGDRIDQPRALHKRLGQQDGAIGLRVYAELFAGDSLQRGQHQPVTSH
ncbi:hypothetical protein RGV33_21055 [Pseudomonas sp. Bout1]|uniref:hypothetical protein n=1 Tax=Pseudomonas sp. Bout1 TaxID=3048600 RepID=UPI002AB567E7|nr:hypothetical protein [Pseudomonas sp. Bout1]MDY7534138.1 hypothetical protein [Pseudomonas sp. Bout1]